MRRVRYQVAMSLDGYIAAPNGEADWIPHDPDVDFAALFSQFDTLLMGRRTYESLRKMGGGPMPGLDVLVFSRTLRQEDVSPSKLVAEDSLSVVRRLKQAPGKDIWLFGGGELFRCLAGEGLVDTVEVAIVPVLLGGGVAAMPPAAARVGLRYQGQRLYPKSGMVVLEYAVT